MTGRREDPQHVGLRSPKVWAPPAALAAPTTLERVHWALCEYATRHNASVDVGEAFVVPPAELDDSWPAALRGLDLGRAVRCVRRLEALACQCQIKSVAFDTTRLPRLSRTPWGERLTKLGFEWSSDLASPRSLVGDATSKSKDRRYAALVGALGAYRAEHGDLVLPRNFRVPSRAPYPAASWGVNLDKTVYNLNFYRDHVARSSARQAELRALGFVWQRLQPEFNLIVEALIAYKERYGDLKVPVRFVVPLSKEDDDDDAPPGVSWPVATRGMPLGRLCSQIRARHDFVDVADKWAMLDRMGFVWSSRAEKRQKLDEALARYRELQDAPRARRNSTTTTTTTGSSSSEDEATDHATPARYGEEDHDDDDEDAAMSEFRKRLKRQRRTTPPVTFVVPVDGEPGADRWPRHLRGYALGRRYYDHALKQRRYGGGPHDDASNDDAAETPPLVVPRAEHLRRRRDESFDRLARALTAYVRTYGDAAVPQRFRVPAGDPAWPSDCAGMPLGHRVAQIRSKGYFVSTTDPRARRRRDILNELGFPWVSPATRGRPRSVNKDSNPRKKKPRASTTSPSEDDPATDDAAASSKEGVMGRGRPRGR